MEIRMPEADQQSIAVALERVIGWLRYAREPAGLSASALSTLARLESAGSLRITDLAAREGLTQPGMTTLVNRLEQEGFAVREPDPADGRAVQVRITPAGIARVGQHRAARSALINSRISELDAGDQHALLAALPALDRFVTNRPASSPTNQR